METVYLSDKELKHLEWIKTSTHNYRTEFTQYQRIFELKVVIGKSQQYATKRGCGECDSSFVVRRVRGDCLAYVKIDGKSCGGSENRFQFKIQELKRVEEPVTSPAILSTTKCQLDLF